VEVRVGDGGERGVLLRAVGDVALVGVAARALANNSELTWPVTASHLAEADITFANLEMPLPRSSLRPARPDVSPDFAGVSAALPALLQADIDIVAIATNHIMDWGLEGLEDTIGQLSERGVAVVGAGRNLDEAISGVTVERSGLRVGFAAFTPAQRWTATESTPGAAPLRLELVEASLEGLRDVDVKVVSLHWGIEMANYPTPQDRALAAMIAEAGADLILGHHPHVVQGTELVGGCPVAYSMGNFVFDIHAGRVKHSFEEWDLRAGYMVEARLTRHGVDDFRTVPTMLTESGIGALADGKDVERIAEHLAAITGNIEEGSRRVWGHAGERLVGHKLNVIKGLMKDTGPRFLLQEISHIRMRHLRLLMGFIASRLRIRRSDRN
jgi:poly-gamma-glutamate synthesis protein (capsule biosynthesis protein)